MIVVEVRARTRPLKMEYILVCWPCRRGRDLNGIHIGRSCPGNSSDKPTCLPAWWPGGGRQPPRLPSKESQPPPFRTARLSQAEGWGREAPAGGPLAGTMARTGKETSASKGVPCPAPVGGGGRRPLRHNAASYRAVLTELCVSFEKVIWISPCYHPQL